LAGAVAEGSEARKITKYAVLLHTHSFAPVAVKTLGMWGAEAEKLLEQLGRRTAEVTQEARSKFFLRQQIDVAIPKGNALSILGTFQIETSALDVSFT